MRLFLKLKTLQKPQTLSILIGVMLFGGIMSLGIYVSMTSAPPATQQLSSQNDYYSSFGPNPLTDVLRSVYQEQRGAEQQIDQKTMPNQPTATPQIGSQQETVSPCTSLSKDLHESVALSHKQYLQSKNATHSSKPKNRSEGTNNDYSQYKAAISIKYQDYKARASQLKCLPVDPSPEIQPK